MDDGSTAYSPLKMRRPRIRPPLSNTRTVKNTHIYERDSDDRGYRSTTDSGTANYRIAHGYSRSISTIERKGKREAGGSGDEEGTTTKNRPGRWHR